MITAATGSDVGISNSIQKGKVDPAFYLVPSATEENIGDTDASGSILDPANARMVNSVQDSVEAYLSRKIFDIAGVEAILARQDKDFLRVWVVINEPDVKIERPVYKIYMNMLRTLPKQSVDLNVLFRFGMDVSELRPVRAHQVSRSPRL